MEVFNLDLRPGRANPVLHCSQFDEGRAFRAMLFDGAAVYTLDGTETITLIEKKLDGNEVTIAVTNTSDNYVDFSTTQQMTALEGSQLCELRIEKGGDLIGSLNFILECEASPDTGIASDSAIHNLEQQIYDAVADQYDSNNVIFDNAPTAGHGVGYVVTSEGTPDELEDLTDVTLTTPTSGEALVWDGSKWTNGTPDLDVSDLADVVITSATDDDILVYDNGQWVNKANPASTANFGADYDENTTYNTGDKCVYNNLLYECNDDGVTGTWDGSKWDSLTVAGMTDNNLPHYTGTPTAGTTAEAIGAKCTIPTQTTLISGENVTTPTTYGYLNKSFTLTDLAVVRVQLGYSNSKPFAIGIKNGTGATNVNLAYTSQQDDAPDCPVSTSTILPAGTYYLWGKSSASAQNPVNVYAWYLK